MPGSRGGSESEVTCQQEDPNVDLAEPASLQAGCNGGALLRCGGAVLLRVTVLLPSKRSFLLDFLAQTKQLIAVAFGIDGFTRFQ